MITTILAIEVLAAVAVSITTLVTLHVLPTGHRPVRDAVSDYGAGGYRLGYVTVVVFLGLAWTLLAADLRKALPHSGAVVTALLVAALARYAIPAFPADLPGQDRTATGRIHLLLAFLAFGGIAVAASNLPARTAHLAAWHAVQPVLSSLGITVIALAVTAAVAPRVTTLAQFAGVIERLLYLVFLTWTVVVAAELIAIAS